jgi:hypothetical protein
VTAPAPVDATRSPARVDQSVTPPQRVDQQSPPTRVDKPASVPTDAKRAPARVDAPVTSPSQVDSARKTSHDGPPPGAHPIDPYGPPTGAKPIDPYGASKPSSGLSRRFDAVFDRYRGAIPIEYLRALVERESSFDPRQRP